MACGRESRNACRVVVRKPAGRSMRGRYICRWEGNIKMDVKEIGWEGMDGTYVAENGDKWWAILNLVMNLWVPLYVENFLTGSGSITFSRRTLLHGLSHDNVLYFYRWLG
jgi:hypothetical protein